MNAIIEQVRAIMRHHGKPISVIELCKAGGWDQAGRKQVAQRVVTMRERGEIKADEQNGELRYVLVDGFSIVKRGRPQKADGTREIVLCTLKAKGELTIDTIMQHNGWLPSENKRIRDNIHGVLSLLRRDGLVVTEARDGKKYHSLIDKPRNPLINMAIYKTAPGSEQALEALREAILSPFREGGNETQPSQCEPNSDDDDQGSQPLPNSEIGETPIADAGEAASSPVVPIADDETTDEARDALQTWSMDRAAIKRPARSDLNLYLRLEVIANDVEDALTDAFEANLDRNLIRSLINASSAINRAVRAYDRS